MLQKVWYILNGIFISLVSSYIAHSSKVGTLDSKHVLNIIHRACTAFSCQLVIAFQHYQTSLKYKVARHPQEGNSVQWIWQHLFCWSNKTSMLVLTSISVSLQLKQEVTNLHSNLGSWKDVNCLWRGLRECYFQHKSSRDGLQLQIATSSSLYILANSVEVSLLTSIHSISVKVCGPIVARISTSRDNFDCWSG